MGNKSAQAHIRIVRGQNYDLLIKVFIFLDIIGWYVKICVVVLSYHMREILYW